MAMSKAITLLGEEKKIRGVWHTKIQCECGTVRFSRRSEILKGRIKSCGCLSRKGGCEKRKHGDSMPSGKYHDIYIRWIGMKSRCYNENNKSYDDYGARGIKVCNEWKESFESFKKWSLNNGYSKELSIDRIDNNGNYDPNNCRWVNRKIQGKNKRNNIYITINGETKGISEWAKHYGFDIELIYTRYNRGDRGMKLFRSKKSVSSWTESEENFLFENYRVMNTKELSNHLGRTEVAVRVRKRKLGLSMRVDK